jgi:hypothetical protein
MLFFDCLFFDRSILLGMRHKESNNFWGKQYEHVKFCPVAKLFTKLKHVWDYVSGWQSKI